jgi:RNA polymerase sigma factor (sigma-70 family)
VAIERGHKFSEVSMAYRPTDDRIPAMDDPKILEGFAVNQAAKFQRMHPEVELKDLIQEARIAIWYAKSRFEGHPFAFWEYARTGIKWQFCMMKRRSLVHGTCSLDDEFGEGTDVITLLNVLESGWAKERDPRLHRFNPEELLLKTETELVAFQRSQELWHAVSNGSGLSPLQRKILRLRFRDGYELEEVAKKLRCKNHNVACNTLRAIRKLRAYFKAKGFDVPDQQGRTLL